jgi:hypothetical protein
MNKEESAALHTGIEVRTPQWETHSSVEAALKALYVVKIQELAELLLYVGRKLGTGQGSTQSLTSEIDWTRNPNIQSALESSRKSQQSVVRQRAKLRLPQEDSQVFPVAFQEDDGWVRMSLTSFYLPPYCCICTVPTRNSLLFQIRNQGESNYYPMHLPTCDHCCAKLKREKRIRNLLVFGLPAASFLPMIFFFSPNRPGLSGLLIGLPLITFVAIGVIMERVYRLPAQVRYSSNKGTLRVRFRNQGFQKMVLAQRVHK